MSETSAAFQRRERAERRALQKEQQHTCMNLTDEFEVCPLTKPSVYYEDRKKQEPGKDDPNIADNGIDYDYSKLNIRELFDDYTSTTKKTSLHGEQKKRQSYIYIISKVVDGRTFFKIGYSDISSKAVVGVRLESHKTTLIDDYD